MEEARENTRLSELFRTIEEGSERITQDIYEGRSEELTKFLDIASRFIIWDNVQDTILNTASNIMLIYVHAPYANSVKRIGPRLEPHENHIHLFIPNTTRPICARADERELRGFNGRPAIEKNLRDVQSAWQELPDILSELSAKYGDRFKYPELNYVPNLNLKVITEVLLNNDEKDNETSARIFVAYGVKPKVWHLRAGNYIQHRICRLFFTRRSFERGLTERFAELELINLLLLFEDHKIWVNSPDQLMKELNVIVDLGMRQARLFFRRFL